MHQIWNDEHVPDKWRPAIESCKSMNPDYTYKLWTMKELEELVRKEYSWFTATFTSESSLNSRNYFAVSEIGELKSDDHFFTNYFAKVKS